MHLILSSNSHFFSALNVLQTDIYRFFFPKIASGKLIKELDGSFVTSRIYCSKNDKIGRCQMTQCIHYQSESDGQEKPTLQKLHFLTPFK